MLLHQNQKIIARDPHRFLVLRCGRRFGKTTLLSERIKGKALAQPHRIAYAANNYQQARDIMWEMLKREMAGAIIDTNESRLEIRTKTQQGGQSYIILRGWESIENLRGQAFDLLCIDEVAQMRNFWLNWQEVLYPTLTDTKGEGMFASTPRGYNHFYDLCNKELTDTDFKSFHFTSYDNPHLPKEELEKAKQTLPADVFGQEYLAEFHRASGLVYKEFQREKHLYEELPESDYKKLAGIDFGFRHPAAVLHVFFNGDTFYVDDEWYKSERTDAQIAEYVAGCDFNAVYPDPENAGGIEELHQRRVNVREVAKGKGSVVAGINTVKEYFLGNRILINKRCVNLIAELEMYSYDENSNKEEPIKEHDDALDALRYLISTISKTIRAPITPQQRQEAQLRKELKQAGIKIPPRRHAFQPPK